MKEAQIKSVALFFFYTFLDKNFSLKASFETLQLIEKRLKERDPLAPQNPVIVYSTYKIWKKYSKKKNMRVQDLPLASEGWMVPDGVKMEPWRQFTKDTDPQVYLAVIWSHLLQFSDKDISEGLGMAEGSIRYRVGKGLKILGQIVSPSGAFDA